MRICRTSQKRSLLYSLFAIVVVLAVVGCRTTRHVPTPRTTPTHREYTTLSFRGTAQGISFTGQLRLAQDSAIWLSVNKFVELGRGLATPDSLHLRLPVLGKQFDGTYADFRAAYGVALSFRQLQNMVADNSIETEVPRLASLLGLQTTLRVTRREHPDTLTFPFRR